MKKSNSNQLLNDDFLYEVKLKLGLVAARHT